MWPIFIINDHSLLEMGFWWAQIALVAVAGVGTAIAYFQLRSLGRQAKATLLLELDRRFEGPELSITRRLLRDMRERVAKKIALQSPQVGDDEKMKLMAAECAKEIEALRSTDSKAYARLLLYMGFFETVGLMLHQKWVDVETVDGLFRGPILAIDLYFQTHITEREKETGVPNGFYEHAMSLKARIQKRAKP